MDAHPSVSNPARTDSVVASERERSDAEGRDSAGQGQDLVSASDLRKRGGEVMVWWASQSVHRRVRMYTARDGGSKHMISEEGRM